MTTQRTRWSVDPAPVESAEAAALLREYYVEVADRYRLLHHGRRSTEDELAVELAAYANDDLSPPRGLFLLGLCGGVASGCAGVRVREPGEVELTRMFVRPQWRGTGGGSGLLDAVDDAARGLGARRIVLDTRLDLLEARGLYVKHGYREIPAYNDGEYAEVWYAKTL